MLVVVEVLPAGLTTHLHHSLPGRTGRALPASRKAYFRLSWKPRCLWELRNLQRLAVEPSSQQHRPGRGGSGVKTPRGWGEGRSGARCPQTPLAQEEEFLGIVIAQDHNPALGVEAGDLSGSHATTIPPHTHTTTAVSQRQRGKLSKQGLPGSFLALPPTPPTSLGNLGHQFLKQKVPMSGGYRKD